MHHFTVCISGCCVLDDEDAQSRLPELEEECRWLKEVVKTPVLTLENVEGCNADFKNYTGLPSIGIFDAIYKNLLAPVVAYITYVGTIGSGSSQRRGRERQLSPGEEFFLCWFVCAVVFMV